jgi:glycosyltransferase involved in cell wall biosynthesis
MRRRRVSNAHAHFASTAARLAYLAWKLGGPPYSVTAHAKDIYHCTVDETGLRQKLVHARFVATVCEANRRYLEQLLGPAAPVRLVPNSVDLRRFTDPTGRRPEAGLILTVARLVEKKGLEHLVTAVGLSADRGEEVRLEVVGDGPLRTDLEALAQAVGAPVVFRGPIDHQEVLTCYQRATVFALPCVVASTGDRDGLPTAVLEAMGAGVPVITTSVNGLADVVIDGVNGLVVPQRNPEALAAAISRVLGDSALADRLGAAARATVEADFCLSESVRKLRSLIGEGGW